MKRCSYCGAEYSDELNKCPIDHESLVLRAKPPPISEDRNLRSGESNRRIFSEVQKLSWFHYVFAALVSYFTSWLLIFFSMFIDHLVLSHPFPYDQFHPERNNSDFSATEFLWMAVPAVINFLILLPFLRFPVRRRIAYICLIAGWLLIAWLLGKFFAADTR